jgi:hypothetical protein
MGAGICGIYLHPRKLIIMNYQNYFNCSGNSPLEMGKLNAGFFQEFVNDFGSSNMNEGLWPAENLLAFIREMKRQSKSLVNRAGMKRAAKLIKEYKSLYKTLVNQ